LRKQFAVIGLGRLGTSVALTLSNLGHDVLAIDNVESNVQAVVNDVTHAVQADARDEDTLKALGIRNFDVAIVAIGNDIEANILTTLMLKEMGVKVVISEAINALHAKVLEKIGADKIVYPEKDMGIRLAHNLVTHNVMDYIEITPGYSVLDVRVPKEYIGKSLGELDLRAKYGTSVLAVKKEEEVLVAPGAEARLEENDVLIVIGKNEDLTKLPE
jgi:trk system potassium uptake protein TrkA